LNDQEALASDLDMLSVPGLSAGKPLVRFSSRRKLMRNFDFE
jgi:hypothetical protein